MLLLDWYVYKYKELSRWLSGRESACQCMNHRRHEFDPWIRKIPWRRKWHPSPVFLPGKSHGHRSLAGCSPWCHKSDRTEHTRTHAHTHMQHCQKAIQMKFVTQNFNNSEIIGCIYFVLNPVYTLSFENLVCVWYWIVHEFNGNKAEHLFSQVLKSIFNLLTFAGLYNEHRLVLIIT